MNMFRKVQLRFTLIPTLISAAMLAAIFSMIYFISFTSAQRLASAHIAMELGRYQTDDYFDVPSDRIGLCMEITVQDGVIESERMEMVAPDDRPDLVQRVLAVQKGKIELNGRTYYVDCAENLQTTDGLVTKYAIYDYTASQSHLRMLQITLTIVYILTILIILWISYMLSDSAVAPLKQAFEKQKELVANASHELKTPLTIVSTNLDLVRSMPELSVAENAKWLDSASYQLTRMNHLIREMLELSALDAFQSQELQDVDVTDLCQGMLLSFEAACYEKNVTLESDIAPDLSLRCSRGELEKLVTILMDNAKKYCNESGTIRFSLQRVGRNLVVRVSNTGEGIPPEKLDRIFERFYKADAAHAESGNSFGLGLSIAQSIATWMGGNISCTSEQGGWTTFEVVLPLHHKYS